MGQKLSYLALGDSYTIGEAVEQAESFPYQLADQLRAREIDIEEPVVIAKTGWTTSELQAAIKSAALEREFDFVTLLIGVNNQYRKESLEVYREQFRALLNTALQFAADDKSRVFVVAIPDWGVTPFGIQSGRGMELIAEEIDAFNAVNKTETLLSGISYTDISADSRLALSDSGLIATDGLHPSGKMYRDWATKLSDNLYSALK